ncbi:hypothetical protein BH10CYA1_BH10CYA1_55910 [soil metagenome]
MHHSRFLKLEVGVQQIGSEDHLPAGVNAVVSSCHVSRSGLAKSEHWI